MEPGLREPLSHSNWVLILGIVLVVAAILWVAGVTLSYRKSRTFSDFRVRALGQVQRERYMRQIGEVQEQYGTGELSAREAHLALAALIRASATERTRMNLESATALEAQQAIPSWPLLSDALQWCADGSFPTEVADQRVERGLHLATAVVQS